MFNQLRKNSIIDQLYVNNIIKLADEKDWFACSPLQVHLHLLSSFPQLLKDIAVLFKDVPKFYDFELIASPYTDIPLATTVSLSYDWPMVFARKERKHYGKENLVEGRFDIDQKVLIIDDQITDIGESLQLIGRLEGSGLKVMGYCVLFADTMTNLSLLEAKGYPVISILQTDSILLRLSEAKLLQPQELEKIQKFYKSNSMLQQKIGLHGLVLH